jgi:hypothetical protein
MYIGIALKNRLSDDDPPDVGLATDGLLEFFDEGWRVCLTFDGFEQLFIWR